LASFPVYAWLHHEPVAWRRPIDFSNTLPRPRGYYAAQGNATRLFFRAERPDWPEGWTVFHASAFAGFGYLLSGGFSKTAFYPTGLLSWIQGCDARLSRWPRLFAARCLVGLQLR
jgi:hypothetical protein